jgi:hypothetical protein
MRTTAREWTAHLQLVEHEMNPNLRGFEQRRIIDKERLVWRNGTFILLRKFALRNRLHSW